MPAATLYDHHDPDADDNNMNMMADGVFKDGQHTSTASNNAVFGAFSRRKTCRGLVCLLIGIMGVMTLFNWSTSVMAIRSNKELGVTPDGLLIAEWTKDDPTKLAVTTIGSGLAFQLPPVHNTMVHHDNEADGMPSHPYSCVGTFCCISSVTI